MLHHDEEFRRFIEDTVRDQPEQFREYHTADSQTKCEMLNAMSKEDAVEFIQMVDKYLLDLWMGECGRDVATSFTD